MFMLISLKKIKTRWAKRTKGAGGDKAPGPMRRYAVFATLFI